MKRTKMEVTVEGPPGGSAERMFECLREFGYTVTVKRIGRRTVADVEAPYGEVDGRSSFLRRVARVEKS